MEPQKEIKKKKVKKSRDHISKISLSVSDLTKKGVDEEDNVTKVSEVQEEESRNTDKPTKVVLDALPIQMVVPIDILGIPNPKPNVDHVSKSNTESSKNQDVDAENYTQTLDSLHVCDKPPSKDDADKLFSDNPVNELVSERVSDTFIDGIIHGYHEDT